MNDNTHIRWARIRPCHRDVAVLAVNEVVEDSRHIGKSLR